MSKIKSFIEREKIKNLIIRLEQADETLGKTYLQVGTEDDEENIDKTRDYITSWIDILYKRVLEFDKQQLKNENEI